MRLGLEEGMETAPGSWRAKTRMDWARRQPENHGKERDWLDKKTGSWGGEGGIGSQ